MMTAIRKRAGDFVAIIVLFVIAAGRGRLHPRPPARCASRSSRRSRSQLNAAFSTAQAVTPGQGQTVRIAGVRIGDIAKVKLDDGRAIVTMDLDPKYDDLVHTDATALLRPKTGLKDMFVEIDPGSTAAPLAKEGWTMPIQNTLPDINPDEILSRARHRHARLPQAAGQRRRPGPRQAGATDLQEVFAPLRADPPRHRQGHLAGADPPGEPAPPDQLAPAAQHRAGQPRRRPRTARFGVGRRVPRLRLGEHKHLARRARLPARAAPDDQHAGQGPDVRRRPRARRRTSCDPPSAR